MKLRVLAVVVPEEPELMRKTPTWNKLVLKYFGEAAPEILRKARIQ